jgi:hypothetical protein
MRFCDPFVLTANSSDCEQALARRKRIGAKSSVQCDQPHFIVFSSRTIFLRPIARPTQADRRKLLLRDGFASLIYDAQQYTTEAMRGNAA